MFNTILFDMDGTLLPMDQDRFTKGYFGKLGAFMAHLHDPEKLIKAVWAGTGAMIKNDGTRTNEAVFWDTYAGIFGPEARSEEPLLAEFYENHFGELQPLCDPDPAVGPLIRDLKAAGYTMAAATNPVFPMSAQKQRLSWTGADPQAFSWVTSYENSSFCKPSAEYFLSVMEKLGASPQESLMVGNDVKEDMDPARKTGMQVFLLTNCLLNKEGKDINDYPHGDLADLKRFIGENGFAPL